jgi:hypothetical protein
MPPASRHARLGTVACHVLTASCQLSLEGAHIEVPITGVHVYKPRREPVPDRGLGGLQRR